MVTFVVVAHSDGVDKGGYVTRARLDGKLPAAYIDAEILAEYENRHEAQTYADTLFRKACGR